MTHDAGTEPTYFEGRRPSRRHGDGDGRRGAVAEVEAVEAILLARVTDAAGLALVEAGRRDAMRLVAHDPSLATETFLASTLVRLLVGAHLDPRDVDAIAVDIGRETYVRPLPVALAAISDPRLIAVPVEPLLDIALALAESWSPISVPSVWTLREPGGPRLVCWRSDAPPLFGRELVLRAAADGDHATQGPWTALVVESFERPVATLVANVEPGADGAASALGRKLAALLARAYERAELYVAGAEHSTALARVAEHRITRVGFDLHDGPLQDLVALQNELGELGSAVAADADRATLAVRVEDLKALVSNLDAEMRQVANSLYTDGEARRPFAEALDGIVRTFLARCGVEADVELEGDLDSVSDVVRTALLRIVEEALTNVRNHSGAENVRLRVVCGPTRIDAVIEDDGAGFDGEAALHDAARRGRLGLFGIVERVRMLGGFCDIDTRPGKGCRISVTVARWNSAGNPVNPDAPPPSTQT